MADTETTTETAEAAASTAGSGGKRKLLAMAVVLTAVMVNLGLAYAFIPSAEQVEAQKRILEGWESKASSGEIDTATVSSDDEELSGETTVEEPLGEFNISAFQPLSGTTIRIDFKLWGIVEIEEVEEFREQYIKNENRAREQILIIMRSADVDDLSEAGLGLIKRKILDKTNHLLNQDYIKSVVFSNFSFVEQ